MRLGHIHLPVRDLPATLAWLQDVAALTPSYHDERMAVVPMGQVAVIFDAADQDVPATLAFASDDCDADFARLVERGAQVVSPPTDQPWGTRSAYVKGPGALTIEVEQVRR